MSSTKWSACGLITLTTDFGQRDPFVGIMKGRILERLPSARIVDLTHEIQPYWPLEAGFWLSRSARYFPPGTVHVAVVDPGVGSDRNSLILETKNYVFLGPDNGMFTAVWEQYRSEVSVRRLALDRLGAFGIGSLSATFHGRDLYAPLAALLASGAYTPADFGEITDDFVVAHSPVTVAPGGTVSGIVATIDRFGNALTNIDAAFLNNLHGITVHSGEICLPLLRTYSDAEPGTLIALVNSFDVLEIAQVQGNAALALGLARGSKIEIRGRTTHSQSSSD